MKVQNQQNNNFGHQLLNQQNCPPQNYQYQQQPTQQPLQQQQQQKQVMQNQLAPQIMTAPPTPLQQNIPFGSNQPGNQGGNHFIHQQPGPQMMGPPQNGSQQNQIAPPPGRGYIPKQVIENYSYCLHDEVGQGYSSKVYRGRDQRSGETVAIQVIDMKMVKNEVQVFLLQNEISVMRKLNNINCLKLLDVFQTSNNTYIITEFCNQGDLKDLLTKYGRLPEKQAVKILVHIINGYQDLTQKHVIHRDIKPANVLLHDGLPKIADFGFAKDLDSPPCRVYYNVGSPIYMSLQSLLNNEYSYKSDIWSIGVLYYELLFGATPWTAQNERELAEQISQVPVQFPTGVDISEDSKDFITKCLQVEESRRIGPSELETHSLIKQASIQYNEEKRKNMMVIEDEGTAPNHHLSGGNFNEQQQQQRTNYSEHYLGQPPSTNNYNFSNKNNCNNENGPHNDQRSYFQNQSQGNNPLSTQNQNKNQSGTSSNHHHNANENYGAAARTLPSPKRNDFNQRMEEQQKENNGPSTLLNTSHSNNGNNNGNGNSSNGSNNFFNVLGNQNHQNAHIPLATPNANFEKILSKANHTNYEQNNQFSVEFGGSFATNSFTSNGNGLGERNNNSGINQSGQSQANSSSTNGTNGQNSSNIAHSNISTASGVFPVSQFSKQISQENDKVILAQINFCRFLYRLGKLIDDNSIFETPFLKERLQFFIMKNIMVKITKLKQMVESGSNPLLLREWTSYSASDSFRQFSSVINEYFVQYSNYFKFHWDNVFSHYGVKDELASDKKFDAVFDLNYIEFESFYIILQSFLRYSIREMNAIIKNQVFEEGEWMPSSVEGAIVLLDYLVTYFQLSSLILDYFGNNSLFAKASKIEQIADGNPVQLTQTHYNQIRNQIQSLEI